MHVCQGLSFRLPKTVGRCPFTVIMLLTGVIFARLASNHTLPRGPRLEGALCS